MNLQSALDALKSFNELGFVPEPDEDPTQMYFDLLKMFSSNGERSGEFSKTHSKTPESPEEYSTAPVFQVNKELDEIGFKIFFRGRDPMVRLYTENHHLAGPSYAKYSYRLEPKVIAQPPYHLRCEVLEERISCSTPTAYRFTLALKSLDATPQIVTEVVKQAKEGIYECLDYYEILADQLERVTVEWDNYISTSELDWKIQEYIN